MKIDLSRLAKGLVLGSAVILILLAPSFGYSQDVVSFQSSNFGDRYIRHKNGLGYLEQIGDKLAEKDASFKVVPGLAGGDTWSFESVNFPGHFLRHQDGRLKLGKKTNDQGFKEDATFRTVAALTGAGDAASLESVNFPGYYIRHKNGEVWVEKSDGTDLFKQDATFMMVKAFKQK